MSNEIQIIEQREVLKKDFKIYGDKENPLFLAKDVADWIEHSRASEMLKGVDEDEKLMQPILASGQSREMWFVTEDGLYEVLMQSRKPIAKQFKKEVKKILKQIRLTGAFASGQSIEDIMICSLNEMKNVKSQLNQVNNNALRASKTSEEVKKNFDELPLFTVDSKELTKNVNRRVVKLLGGKTNIAYKELSKKVFSDIYRQLWREFGVMSIAAIKRKDLDEAKFIVGEYKLPRIIQKEIEELANQIALEV